MLGPVTERERLDQVLEEVVGPLLEVDGGGIEIVDHEEGDVLLRITGALASDPGVDIVRTGLIEPALKAAVGPDLTIRYEGLGARR